MRSFGVPLQWGEKVFSGPFGCGYHVCQSKQLLRCFDSFRCLQHGCAFGKSTTLIQFLFIRSSNLEYHPKLLIYHYVKLIYHYVKSEYKYIYIYVTTMISFLSTLPSILTLGLQGSVLCAAKPEEFWVGNWQGGMFPLQTGMFGTRMAYFALNLNSKGSNDPQNRLGCSVPLSMFAWCFDDSYEQL